MKKMWKLEDQFCIFALNILHHFYMYLLIKVWKILVERCPYMDPSSPLHQPQFATWTNYGQNYDFRYDTRITLKVYVCQKMWP